MYSSLPDKPAGSVDVAILYLFKAREHEGITGFHGHLHILD